MTSIDTGGTAGPPDPGRLGQGVVLLATDGSADAAIARVAAVQLATQSGFALHIVHAWQVHAVVGGFPGYAAPPEFFEGCEESAREVLDAECHQVIASGATIAGTHLVEGRPAQAITAVADHIDASLVALGSRGLGGLGRLVVGSVSEETLHMIHRPMLILRGAPGAWPPTEIIAGDDGSPNALTATAMAARVAHILDVPVVMMRVLPQLDEGGAPRRDDAAALVAAVQTRLDERAAGIRERTGADVRTLVTGANPAGALLQTAEARGAGLIATGCRGAGLMTRMRLGSVSNRLLHGSQVPMLIVPASARVTADHGGA